MDNNYSSFESTIILNYSANTSNIQVNVKGWKLVQNDTNLKVYTDGQSAEVYFKLSNQTLSDGAFKGIGTINSLYRPLYPIGVNGDTSSITHSKVMIDASNGLVQGRNITGKQATINFENSVMYKLANPLY